MNGEKYDALTSTFNEDKNIHVVVETSGLSNVDGTQVNTNMV